MKTLITILLFSFIGLYSCKWIPGGKCCPESDLGILCENSTALSFPYCGPGKECCLRLDLAYTCCNEATEFCNPTLGGCIPKSQAPANLTSIKVGIFSESLSFAIARTRFLWIQEDLNVTYVVVRGSTNQFELLKNKQIDFIATGIDNSINYHLNVNNPVGQGTIKTVSVLATDLGSHHSIVVLPNITTFSDLTNTIVGVDAAASGFAYIVYDILASGGLVYGQDYHVKEVGGGAQRLAAITAGNASAVLLSGEQLIVAKARGFKVLRTYADIKNPIELVSAVSVPVDFLENNASVIHKFLRAYYIATQYLTNPANRNTIISLIEAANISSNSSAFYDLSTSPIYGVKANGVVTPQGMYEVISLRNRYGGFENGTLSNATICKLTRPRGIFTNQDGLFSTIHLQLAVNSLGYSFNSSSKSCEDLGLPSSIVNDSSAFTFVMPVALIFTVVLSLFLL